MQRKKINKIFKEIKSLDPATLTTVRDKLIPVFLNLEKLEPYKNKEVIKMLRRRYRLALNEYKSGKLIDAESYIRKKIG